jgi:hypothetical protein
VTYAYSFRSLSEDATRYLKETVRENMEIYESLLKIQACVANLPSTIFAVQQDAFELEDILGRTFSLQYEIFVTRKCSQRCSLACSRIYREIRL